SPAICLRSSCNSSQISSTPWNGGSDEQFYNMSVGIYIVHLLRGQRGPLETCKSVAVRLRSSCNSSQISSTPWNGGSDEQFYNMSVGIYIVHLLRCLRGPLASNKSPAVCLRSSCNSSQISNTPWNGRSDEQFYNMSVDI